MNESLNKENYLENKKKKFDFIFANKIINKEEIQRLSWGGIPNEYRGILWRLLLETSTLNLNLYKNTLENKRDKYFYEFLQTEKSMEFCVSGFSKINSNEDKKMENLIFNFKNCNFKISGRSKRQIEIDVQRISDEQKIYSKIDLSYIFKNILSLTAQRKPAVGYVQGMADILVPFIHTFATETSPIDLQITESSSYFCFTRFLEEIQENFIDLQPGITKSIEEFKNALEAIDPELFLYLQNINLQSDLFVFRWFNCFFLREFVLKDSLIIFDTLFSYKNINFKQFSIFFGISLLCFFRNEIFGKDFCDTLLFLQNINQKKWKLSEIHVLLSTTYVNQHIYNKQVF
ncbi:Rab-GTPase-TBC domain-containing protein [Hamiltosporidium tvaerminnensis]|uniref:Rab-GTPase-TBC domain-containing protein n=2 Tax=Hamiltosporidium TaxID=1176354 RepID=A0A4Q9LRW8_9MICR|nr:Rab-GTPase-TBC domain-containing protein [Hamiltosporidium magnivora]TBU10947.1 Rab-GTPase-TBC domain-containing protein [Hamiltosporidium tvaerminnensis]TBU10997.1 Rab-GTPase-TBC domain-containing protein [Hamiltosporidium tvaerminnensis]